MFFNSTALLTSNQMCCLEKGKKKKKKKKKKKEVRSVRTSDGFKGAGGADLSGANRES